MAVRPATTPHRGPGRRKSRVRWGRILRVALIVLLVAGVFGLLPRLGRAEKEAQVLRHANLDLVSAAVLAESLSLITYTDYYRRLLLALGHRVRYRRVFEVFLAYSFVSHLAIGGAATGMVVNIRALKASDVPAEAAGEAYGFAVLFSGLSELTLLAAGLGLSFRQEALAPGYLIAAVAVLMATLTSVAVAAALARRPRMAEKLGRRIAELRLVRRWWPALGPDRAASAAVQFADGARQVLAPRTLAGILAPALGEMVLDVAALYLFFAAAGHRPAVGAILVAYGAANVAGLTPVTPGGLGAIEAALIAITVAFGTPAHVAVPAVLGYRLVNFWLPLPVGAVAYLRVRRRDR